MDATLATTAPAFFGEVAALLVGSAAIAYVCHRLGIMPIVSFLLTGAVVGPHALGLVQDEALIEATAELGVILLLFTIGIEFSLEKLARIKRLILLGGGLQIGLVVVLVTAILAALGVEWRTGVFTGCLVALSSTAIVMKLLMGGSDMASQEGQAALGILIFQDLAVVAMVLLVPMLGGMGGSGLDVSLALGKAVGIVALVLVAARRIMPKVLEAVARTCSQEIFLLTVVGICFGTAFLTSLAGVSLSLGAFLAGLVVSESRFSQLAFGEILPLQILFSATFFVSVGLLLDVSFLIEHPLLILLVVATVLAIKLLTTGISLKMLGYGAGPAACTALVLAQVGEFSFVLERTGRGMGLYPAGVETGGPEAFIGATVLLMIATPFLYRFANVLRKAGAHHEQAMVPAPPPVGTPPEQRGSDVNLRDHVVIAGLGDVGRSVAQVLEQRQLPYLVVTLSPDRALDAERGELRVLRGDYTRQHELTVAGIRWARLLVVADDDLATTRRVVAAAHALNPDLPVYARTRFASEVQELREAGASEVISEEQESVVHLLTRVLEVNEVGADDIRHYQDMLRSSGRAIGRRSVLGRLLAENLVVLTVAQRQSSACAHAAGATEAFPSASACEDCVKTGDRWVHLRICMTCGHVGCCDSSRNRHATKHYVATGHEIVKSLEPGEAWAWCYEDQRIL